MDNIINSAKSLAQRSAEEASKRMQDMMFQQQRDFSNQAFQVQENAKQFRAYDILSAKLENQNITQNQMTSAIYELVNTQQESNRIIESQCEELKRQNKILEEQNKSQAQELKHQKIWNWITYGITTLIAITSVIATFIGIFR